MRVILISIKPKYAEKIIFGSKTIELRRIAPNLDKPEIIVIYESSPVKAITGYAVVQSITKSSPEDVWNRYSDETQISKDDFDNYYDGTDSACALHITKVTRLAAPISLEALRNENILQNPPQSYRYLNVRSFKSFIAAARANDNNLA